MASERPSRSDSLRTYRRLKKCLSIGPVRFMGAHHRSWWWDIRTPHGYLVVRAGWIKHPKWPQVYWSPNATPWHHGARNVFRARFVYREQCVCRRPDCTNPQEVAR